MPGAVAIVWTVVVIASVLGLAELSARLWRRRHPTTDRFTRFRQWRVFSSLWMLVAAGVFGVLVATHVLGTRR